jgi:methionyl-tRNA synthetase
MTAAYEQGIVPAVDLDEEPEKKINDLWSSTKEAVLDCFSTYQFSQALDKTFVFIRGINKYADERTPWKLAKSEDAEDRQALRTCLGTMIESLRLASALLAAVMPLVHEQINERLGLTPCVLWKDDLVWDHRLVGKKLGEKTILFPREV